MISRNSSLKYKQPFLLKPIGKDYLWGGNRLNEDFSKGIDMSPLAETWECSTHPDGLSIVASGEFRGWTLRDVLRENPEFLGSNSKMGTELPIIIKLIDAKQNLSVQVHPDDDYANRYENGQHGKLEMWYVLDTMGETSLVYGFSHDMKKETLKKSLREGKLEKYLQKVPVHKDDMFYIDAGTVHAIGAGALVAEIQENSNLTYRLYDYNRIDKNGKSRELHIEKALDVVRLKGSAEPKQPMRILRYQKGCASEFLCRCQYFQVDRLLVNTERCRKMASFWIDGASFQVMLCTEGCGVIVDEKNGMIEFFRGDCIFIPADAGLIKIHGKAQFLKVMC